MNFELLRELAGLPTLKEAAGFRFQPSWCLIDSHTDEVLSSSSDKQKLIAKQEEKYGQTSTEIAWGYPDEDGDFVGTYVDEVKQETVVKEAASVKPRWCLIDSQTDEVLSSSSDKQKLIVKQNGKYGQTSTELMWGYADEDGDFVEVKQETVVKEAYHDSSDFDAAINEVLDHLHAAQKIVSTPEWKRHMVDAVDQGAPESTVATNKTMTMRLDTLIDSYVALYESFEDL